MPSNRTSGGWARFISSLGRGPRNRFHGATLAVRAVALDVVGEVFLIDRRRNLLFREQE
jgi:hypothetical protein